MSYSTLDLIRLQAAAGLENCPKDEARTRDYLHRTQIACELVVGRQKHRRDKLLGAQSGRGKEVDKVELPKISSSAPSSPERRGASSRLGSIRDMLESVRTLSRDQRSLSAMAKLHGDVEVEFQIPPDVTWSDGMATKPREVS